MAIDVILIFRLLVPFSAPVNEGVKDKRLLA